MIKQLILILPLYLAWPPITMTACHVGGEDLTNFKQRNIHRNEVAPVPYQGNEQAYGNTTVVASVEGTRRKSPLKREMQALEGKAVDESKKDESSVDLTELDLMTVVVPSASGGSK